MKSLEFQDHLHNYGALMQFDWQTLLTVVWLWSYKWIWSISNKNCNSESWLKTESKQIETIIDKWAKWFIHCRFKIKQRQKLLWHCFLFGQQIIFYFIRYTCTVLNYMVDMIQSSQNTTSITVSLSISLTVKYNK